jgi:hypothetical protein
MDMKMSSARPDRVVMVTSVRRRSGCGPTTTTAQTWPWAGSLLNSGWPWLRNVSTSATLAKGEDYPQ